MNGHASLKINLLNLKIFQKNNFAVAIFKYYLFRCCKKSLTPIIRNLILFGQSYFFIRFFSCFLWFSKASLFRAEKLERILSSESRLLQHKNKNNCSNLKHIPMYYMYIFRHILRNTVFFVFSINNLSSVFCCVLFYIIRSQFVVIDTRMRKPHVC